MPQTRGCCALSYLGMQLHDGPTLAELVIVSQQLKTQSYCHRTVTTAARTCSVPALTAGCPATFSMKADTAFGSSVPDARRGSSVQ